MNFYNPSNVTAYQIVRKSCEYSSNHILHKCWRDQRPQFFQTCLLFAVTCHLPAMLLIPDVWNIESKIWSYLRHCCFVYSYHISTFSFNASKVGRQCLDVSISEKKVANTKRKTKRRSRARRFWCWGTCWGSPSPGGRQLGVLVSWSVCPTREFVIVHLSLC